MFTTTRIRLTLWYTLTIVLISTCFSAAIFQFTNLELHRFARIQRYGFERRLNMFNNPGFPSPPPTMVFDEEALIETRNRIIFILIGINLGIAVVSGFGGYVLSGKTLAPIRHMLTKQEQFVANTSHELKTPITALIASSEVALRDKKMTLHDAKNVIQTNLDVAKNMHLLANRLLELSKVKHLDSVHSSPFLLYDLIDAVYLELHPLIESKHLNLINQINKDFRLKGYPLASIKQVVTIILDNAIKFSHPLSQIEINSTTKDQKLYISISDHGIGISPTDLPHIFDRFYQASVSRTKQTNQGFGLGLAIAKNILDTLHGSIQVKSVVAKGSTFIIVLPIIS